MPTSGVFLNMVTKSGSDAWRGRTTFAWLGDATQTQNIDDELLRNGFRPETNSVDFVSDINVSAGGPLVERKLRMFGSFRDWRVHVNTPAAFSTLVLDKTDITSGLVNMNYQINDNHRLTGFSRQCTRNPIASLPHPTSSSRNPPAMKTTCSMSIRCCGMRSSPRLFVDALRAESDLLPHVSERKRSNAARHRHQHPHAQFHVRHRAVARPLPATRPPTITLTKRWAAGTSSRSASTTPHAVENRVVRFDDVEVQYAARPACPERDAVWHPVPFEDCGRCHGPLRAGQLFDQEPDPDRRRRWEGLEGYLPEQSSPPSRFFPNLVRSFPEQRDIISWNTIGPRISGACDLRGDGRTALKASAGRYYYVIASGGGPLDTANPNGNYQEQYGWNDVNGDRRFQPGEQTGEPVITRVDTSTISFDPTTIVPTPTSTLAGVDHELLPAVRLSVVYTYRRERDIQASSNPANPYDTFLTTAPTTDATVSRARRMMGRSSSTTARQRG